MKIAIKANTWQQAINHLREMRISNIQSCKKVKDEFIFKVTL